MKAKHKSLNLIGLLVLLTLGALGYFEIRPGGETAKQATSAQSASPSQELTPKSSEPPSASQLVQGPRRVVQDAVVKNHGEVIYRGSVDLSATMERIQAGEKFPHRNDGAVFGNREGLLPRQPRGYYREYVHPTEGITGPGPQRLVVGSDGDWWYTPDHYASFIRLNEPAP